jgi:hypothetical protein
VMSLTRFTHQLLVICKQGGVMLAQLL